MVAAELAEIERLRLEAEAAEEEESANKKG